MTEAKWKTWLADEELRRWYENHARGSLSGALGYIRVLYRSSLAPFKSQPGIEPS